MKRLIIVAILTVALIVPFTADKAGADELLFPWIVKNNGVVSTVVSVVNTAGTTIQNPLFTQQLHYSYKWKSLDGTADDQTKPCQDQDDKFPTTKDDLITWDAAGYFNGGEPFYGDDTAGYADINLSLLGTAVKRAYLIVDNNTPFFSSRNVNTDGTLYGEAMVLEIDGGAAWGYIAYNASSSFVSTQNAPVTFEDGTDLLGEVIGDDEETQMVVQPDNFVRTKMFVTPTTPINGSFGPPISQNPRGQREEALNVQVSLCLSPDQAGACSGLATGWYDMDEQPDSFTSGKEIVCTSADDLREPSDTLGVGHYYVPMDFFDAWAASGDSAWAYVLTTIGNNDGDNLTTNNHETNEAIIGKLEFNTGAATLEGVAIPGTYNNFYWLRDNETVTTESGINYIHNESCDPDCITP